ncbi:MAG: dihydrolipoyl dehydrogenase [Myxococcota bacterium]
MSDYDLVVIGSGPGGYVAAIYGAQNGLKTAIIEKDSTLGGTCLNRGCIPTKALLEAAHLWDKMHHSKKFGILTSGIELDWTKTQKYRDKVVKQNTGGVSYLMRKNKIDVIQGHGRLNGAKKVDVTDADGNVQTLNAKNVIVATGSVCKELGFIPMDHERVINSDDILELAVVPESLIIMGAGAVGTEFASIYNTFGSEVTLIELMDRLLPIEDEDISKELEKSFKRRKINCLTNHRIERVERVGDKVEVDVKDPNGETVSMSADYFLMAAGRQPVSYDVGLENTAIEVDPKRETIKVDPYMQTNEPGVYAIGDVIDTPWLAHVASHEGILAVDHLLGKDPHPIDYRQTPSCTYCHPEVASIGLTERQAREMGYEVKVGTFPFSANPRARIMQESEGLIKMVSDAKYDEVLGLHIIGPKATELILEGGMALRMEATTEEIVHTIHAHPTLGEALGEAAHAVLGEAIHI